MFTVFIWSNILPEIALKAQFFHFKNLYCVEFFLIYGNIKTICKFGERKNLAIKKFSKTIFYKQTQAKLSPTKMELCGGENLYRKGLLTAPSLHFIAFYFDKKERKFYSYKKLAG